MEQFHSRRMFSPIFENVDFVPFTPKAINCPGRHLATRIGALFPSPRHIALSSYHNPKDFMSFVGISLASIARRPIATLHNPGTKHGLIHSMWTGGYYHWITESLPRAYVLKQTFPEAIPLLPSQYYATYVDSLVALGFPTVDFFPEGSNVWLRDPVLTSCIPYARVCPSLLNDVVETITKLHSGGQTAKRRVYVSRTLARGRKILNEQEVVSLVQSHGFEIVHFEQLSFAEQVRLMQETSFLVGIHGAGLTNTLFMPRNGAVLEILARRHGAFDFSTTRNTFRHNSCFIRLAQTRGHRYDFLQAHADVPFYRGTHMADLQVDLDELDQKLDQLTSCED